VRICTGASCEDADVISPHADLRGIAHTIDIARHSMRIAGHGKAIATGSAAVNLGLAFVPPLAATFISTVATGLQAVNTMRELPAEPASDPEPMPAAARS
jgi:cation transport ATPase